MNSKEFLTQAVRLEQAISARLREIEHYRTLAEGAGAIRYDRDGVQTQRSQNAPFEAPLIRAADLEVEARKEIDELWKVLKIIRGAIAKVEDLNVQNVLRLRFLANHEIDEIASELKVSRQTVIRRLDAGYIAVAKLTELPEPIRPRMPARDRHAAAKEMIREVLENGVEV